MGLLILRYIFIVAIVCGVGFFILTKKTPKLIKLGLIVSLTAVFFFLFQYGNFRQAPFSQDTIEKEIPQFYEYYIKKYDEEGVNGNYSHILEDGRYTVQISVNEISDNPVTENEDEDEDIDGIAITQVKQVNWCDNIKANKYLSKEGKINGIEYYFSPLMGDREYRYFQLGLFDGYEGSYALKKGSKIIIVIYFLENPFENSFKNFILCSLFNLKPDNYSLLAYPFAAYDE